MKNIPIPIIASVMSLIVSFLAIFFCLELSTRINELLKIQIEQVKTMDGLQENQSGILDNMQLLVDTIKEYAE